LKNDRLLIEESIKKYKLIPNFYPLAEVYEADIQSKSKAVFGFEKLYDPVKNIHIEYKYYRFIVPTNQKKYDVTVRRALIITATVRNILIISIFCLASGIILSYLIIIKLQNREIWNRFFTSLSNIRNYQLTGKGDFEIEHDGIDEFRELNEIIQEFIETNRKDYDALQEFTENSVHELQTPLAIIKGNIENLIQDRTLTEDQIKLIDNITQATTRLSKLNHGLSLLAKIDNLQFSDINEIQLANIVTLILNDFKEPIEFKRINVETNLNNSFTVKMNENLAIILITNLIKNAIRYNIEDGLIKIDESNRVLSISNTGEKLTGSTEKYFKRFSKQNQKSKSLGLGLAIVKRIADVYRLDIKYKYRENLHTLKIIKYK
jgi:signal transduction histidine kinase